MSDRSEIYNSSAQPNEWRCFHCSMVLKTYPEALSHFGPTVDHRPACQGDGGSWGQRLRHHVKSLLNGLDTGAVRIETDQDETLARDMKFIRYAVDHFESDLPANAETHRTESAGSTPPAVFSAPTPPPVESN